MSIEKLRKDTRDRKETRGTKYTYSDSCFLILLLVKSKTRTFTLLKFCLLYLCNMKAKDIAVHLLKKDLKLCEIIILVEQFY